MFVSRNYSSAFARASATDTAWRATQALVARAGIKEDTRWCDVKNTDLRVLADGIAACTLSVSGKGSFKDEFVTAGGVALTGVDMKRMESKAVKGLFFAGEVLDVDGITGGFNFQSAWTTGWTAGRAIGEDAAQRAQ